MYFERNDAMQKNIYHHYTELIKNICGLDATVERPRERHFGDLSSNVAMVIAKKLRKNPMDAANELLSALSSCQDFERLEVVRPGFINWRVPKHLTRRHLQEMCRGGYGHADIGRGAMVNIEYVSANPTGPLHAGHARGAVFGDVLANLLEYVGFCVCREYYVNDAGGQIDVLAQSLYHRYLEVLGHTKDEIPEGMYPGEYLLDIARDIVARYGDMYVDLSADVLALFKEIAVSAIMTQIKDDLERLGIKHDVFYSERDIIESIPDSIELLERTGYIYRGVLSSPKGVDDSEWTSREQLLFKSDGDDSDRALQKSSGEWTYFASDIAYHHNKLQRGFKFLINVLGADHGGYVKRLQNAVGALSASLYDSEESQVALEVCLCQLVRFVEDGKEVRMSKRAGRFITIADVLDAVGSDIVRFVMLSRKEDSPMDFDFQKVLEHSKDNPVYYVQYAYARSHSVLKQFKAAYGDFDIECIDWSQLCEDEFFNLAQSLMQWPQTVLTAARKREPHRIVFFLIELAGAFHGLWNLGKDNIELRFINESNESSKARVGLVYAMQKVLANGLEILGVSVRDVL